MVNTEKQLEEFYLRTVYSKLLETESDLENLLKEAKREGIDALKSMSGDISLNFDSFSDNFDTFSMIEIKNREIDQMNIKNKTADVLLQKVKRLLNAPYFGKVSVDFLVEEEIEQFYIGINNFADEDGNNLIYDWRSPIAELFYNNTIGKSSYTVNKNQIDVEIEKRRQFILEKDQLIKFFDTSIAIQDDVLLEALEQDSTNEMKDITATIQKEQNNIIRDTKNKNILVNGIAGSGKTSAIMQRIAYLLYLYRQEITSDNILILSPNNKFIDYISQVLPSLGEKNPLNFTILQFVERHLPRKVEDEEGYFQRISATNSIKQTETLRNKAYIDHIKNSDQLFLTTDSFFKDLTKKGKVIISKEKIAEVYHSTPDHSKLIDKLQTTKKILLNDWENRINKQAKGTAIQNQILSLSEELQQKYFGEIISDDSEKNIYKYGKSLLNRQYRGITKGIENNEWIDTGFIFNELFLDYTKQEYVFVNEDHYTLDEAIIFLTIQHTLIEKINLTQMRFVLIDEIQDYTPAQISLLLDLFSKSEVTMVGDENQAIFNSNISFEEIENFFVERTAVVKRYDLLNSYRSSGSITNLFKQLATDNRNMDIIPVRKDGQDPKFIPCNSLNELPQIVAEVIKNLQVDSLTIITKTDAEAREVKTAIKNSTLPDLAINVSPISLSKGLEFDNVLLYNVSIDNFTTKRDMKILYTEISRAMQNIVVTYKKQLPEILTGK